MYQEFRDANGNLICGLEIPELNEFKRAGSDDQFLYTVAFTEADYNRILCWDRIGDKRVKPRSIVAWDDIQLATSFCLFNLSELISAPTDSEEFTSTLELLIKMNPKVLKVSRTQLLELPTRAPLTFPTMALINPPNENFPDCVPVSFFGHIEHLVVLDIKEPARELLKRRGFEW